MNKLILLESVRHNLVWGSEDWIISAHPNGDNIVSSQNTTLSNFYKENCNLFGVEGLFPLLVKIIDAKSDLSIQVHPGDEYALKYENSLGKTECWYVLDCEDDADIIIGINAHSREELNKLIAENEIESCLNIVKVKKGDFFFIPAGCVHAIRKNTKILEVQQSSDITYRLYDYNRPDIDGNLRELHIDKSLDVIDYDFKLSENKQKILKIADSQITTLVDSSFFTVEICEVVKSLHFDNNYNFLLCVALDDLVVNNEKIAAEQGFIVPKNTNVEIIGNGQLVVSYIK